MEYYQMRFDHRFPCAIQPPGLCGHDRFLHTLIWNLDYKDADEYSLFRWVSTTYVTILTTATE
eukprot:8755899-Pyramimonas_sp.AAC.1